MKIQNFNLLSWLLLKKTLVIIMLFSFNNNLYSQSYWRLEGNSDLSTEKDQWLGSINDYDLRFITNNIERVRITSSGFMGIGVTNPTELLDINGAIRIRGGNPISGKFLTTDNNGFATWSFVSWDNIINKPSNLLDFGITDALNISHPAGSIEYVHIENWHNAYEWGNHANEGYLMEFQEQDPFFIQHFDFHNPEEEEIIVFNGSKWTNLSHSFVSEESDPLFTASPANTISTQNISDWSETHSWGNHANEGYLLDFQEQDPFFIQNFDFHNPEEDEIIVFNGSKWTNLSHSFVSEESDPLFTASPANTISTQNISNWSEAYSWGNHANEGYLTTFQESDPTWAGSLSTNGAISRSGRVGLGTNSPSNMLHIHSDSYLGSGRGPNNSSQININPPVLESRSSSSSIQLTNKNTGDESNKGLHITSINKNGIIDLKEEGSLFFRTSDNLAMIIDSKGKVGVGTNAPAESLHIKGTARIGGAEGVTGVAEALNTGSLFLEAELRFGNANTAQSFIDEVYQPMIYGTSSGGGNFSSSCLVMQAGGIGENRHIFLRTANRNRVTVHNNGNLGVGTVSPNNLVHIHSSVTEIFTNEQEDPWEDFGVGDFSPKSFIAPEMGVSHSAIQLTNALTGEDAERGFHIKSSNNTASLHLKEVHGYMSLNVNNNEGLRISENGNVGIGIELPATRLHINNGDAVITNGQLGVGTNAPFSDLEVRNDNPGGIGAVLTLTNHSHQHHSNTAVQFRRSPIVNTGDQIIGNIEVGSMSASGGRSYMNFQTYEQNQGLKTRLKITEDGKIKACGVIRSGTEVVVETLDWCDFVFSADYTLEPFKERIAIIKEKRHLPNVLPEKNIIENGVPIKQTLQGVLQNVEEMYLYINEMHDNMEELMKKVNAVEAENLKLRKMLNK